MVLDIFNYSERDTLEEEFGIGREISDMSVFNQLSLDELAEILEYDHQSDLIYFVINSIISANDQSDHDYYLIIDVNDDGIEANIGDGVPSIHSIGEDVYIFTQRDLYDGIPGYVCLPQAEENLNLNAEWHDVLAEIF